LHDELHWLDIPERIEYKLGVTVPVSALRGTSLPRRPPHPTLMLPLAVIVYDLPT